jgi:hypothetical protein
MNELIEALRSGKYQQIHGSLRSNEGFCCLGVACDIYTKIHPDEFQWYYDGLYWSLLDYYDKSMSYTAHLPQKIAKYFGLNNKYGKFNPPPEFADIPTGQCNLMYLNDTLKWSFKTLASFLKTNPTFKGDY